jgi:hypothetical protein
VDQVTLVSQSLLEAGRRLIEKLENAGMLILSAFWMFQPERDGWRFVLATHGAGVDLGGEYLKVSKALVGDEDLLAVLSSSDIEIVTPKDRTISLLRHGIGVSVRPMTRWHRSSVRGNIVEDAVIYRLAA